jgi:hypothetical protein
MGDSRIQQTWKKEGNHNTTTHLEFHAFCQQAQSTRHDDRAPPAHQESPQRNATCAGNRGREHCRTVGRQARRTFGRSSGRLKNSVVVVLGTLAQEPPVIKKGILCEEDPSCGGLFEPQFVAQFGIDLERGKAKIEAFVDFCCPNFC